MAAFATYPIKSLDALSPQRDEPMGTQLKHWFTLQEGERWLFKSKEERPLAGQDFAEKIAGELAALLEIPHAHIEFAVYWGQRGIISRDFTGNAAYLRLEHGNNFLFGVDADYPRLHRSPSAHTVRRVLFALHRERVLSPVPQTGDPRIEQGVGLFVGYLLLDALIGHTDRHHQNWGVLLRRKEAPGPMPPYELAPTFDHAASLSQELTDEQRSKRLAGGQDAVRAYCDRARSGFFAQDEDPKPVSPIGAFLLAAQSYPGAANAWRKWLGRLKFDQIQDVIARVPNERMSAKSKEFVYRLLCINYQRLLEEQP